MEIDDNMNLRVDSFSCYLDTDKDNLVRRILAQDTPILLTSPSKTMSPTTYSKDTNLRVDSFSYNLKNSAENFAFSVDPGPIQDPTSAFTFPRSSTKDGEISIFGADRYFNMKLEYPTMLKQDERPVNLARVGSDVAKPIRTPSLCSEASSWNSQSALIQRVGSRKSHKKAFGRRIFAGFGCHAPCFDKKGVHIDPYYGPSTYPNRALIPIPNHGPEKNFAVYKKPKEVPTLCNFDESRNSIEVFGSKASPKGNMINNVVATNMERKLSMLTWDAIPKLGQNFVPSRSSTYICDDMASDASSDLFEIENISGSMYPISSTTEVADHDDDDMSSCMSPTSHCAPSEASIQWSVVTASAADYSSVISDRYNDDTSVSIAGERMASNNNKIPKRRNGGGKEGRVGGLLGCKSLKGVNVAENACRKGDIDDQKPKQHQGLDLYGKSQGNIRGRVKDIETLQLQRSFDSSGFLL